MPAKTSYSDPEALRQPRVLLVEDDYFIVLEMEYRLLQAGFAVVGIARTADEAVQIASSERPDIAVMDIRLAGGRDGVDAAKELFTTMGVPSIFATAHADQETRCRAEEAQPRGWLEKPYSAESLITALNAAFASRNNGR